MLDVRTPGATAPATPPGTAVERLAWLDALRAIAALLVVYAHLSHYLLRGARAVTSEWLHAGPAGVMLFFLVSGYIVPASLERHGSLRTFWLGRLFRLVPLYLVVAVLVAGLGATGLVPLDPYLPAHPVTAAVAYATMLPFLLGVPLLTPVFWTLTFEMTFYLLVTALFAVRLHRGSGAVAVVLAAVGVLSAPLAPRLLTGTAGVRDVTLAVAAALALGLAAVAGRRRWAVVAGGLLLGAVAATLLTAGADPAHVWDGLLIPAVMFAGTTLYRADRGQVGWWQPVVVCGVVAAALLVNWFAELASLDALTPGYRARAVVTLVVFAGAFAVARAFRRRRVPRWLAGLGLISYSVYLVHHVLIQLLAPVLTTLGERLAGPAEIPAVAAYLGLLVGVSWLTYRFVELPGQRLGRRLAERWRTVAPAMSPTGDAKVRRRP